MHVLVAHDYYQHRGGEDFCVEAEIQLLRSHGHTVTEHLVHNDAIRGMARASVAIDAIWSRKTYRQIRALIRDARPDIVHFHNLFPLLSPSAYYAARAEDVAVVQTLHNFRMICPNALLYRDGEVCEECVGRRIPWPSVIHGCYRDDRFATADVAAMLAIHRALGTWKNAVDLYIALTEFSRNKLIAGGVPSDKLVVKPNFSSHDPGPGAGDGGYALYVGRLSQEKGVALLLNAWRALTAPTPLHIIGDGPQANIVRDAAATDNRIVWKGAAPSDAVMKAIGAAAYLIVPSLCYENFPRVIVEAFAVGTPVIVPTVGSAAEIVQDGVTGLTFSFGSSADLALTAQRLADAPALLAPMREAARKAFEQNFTEARNHAKLMEIYERALSSRSTSAIAAPTGPAAFRG